MRKAQVAYVTGAITMAVVGMLAYATANGGLLNSSEFIKEQTIDIQAERVKNAALSLESVHAGSVEVEMEGYEYKWNEADRKFFIKYKGKEGSTSIPESLVSYERVEATGSYENAEGSLCLTKKYDGGDPVLEIEKGGCS